MGFLEDISPAFDAEFLAGFYPEMLNSFKLNGELFGLPSAPRRLC
jgi:maltose-binding protein MalE